MTSLKYLWESYSGKSSPWTMLMYNGNYLVYGNTAMDTI